jgi:hypothetical protein
MTNKEMEKIMANKLSVIQYRNTTIYYNDNICLLSPYIGSENKNHWFDIRVANLETQNKQSKLSPVPLKWLIIRDCLYGFLVCSFDGFKKEMLVRKAVVNGPHSGENWKFLVKKDNSEKYCVQGQHGDKNIYIVDFMGLDCII